MRGLWTLLTLALLAAAAWWGLRTMAPGLLTARTQAVEPTEVCAVALSGSNTIGEALAPALIVRFLESRGYTVGGVENTAADEVRVIGAREDRVCTVSIRSHGTSNAFSELSAGTAQIGMASRAIKPQEISNLRAVGAGDFDAQQAQAEHVIALDGIAVIVSPANPLRRLSMAEARRIFLAQTTSWRALGGEDAQIHLYARDDASGTMQFFFEHVLGGAPEWTAARTMASRYESSSQLTAAVAGDPQGIGFVGGAYVDDSVRALDISNGGPAFPPSAEAVRAEEYPIARRLFFYTRPDTVRTNRFVAAFIDFAKSPAAYPIVEAQRFISLRSQASAAAPASTACVRGAAEAEVYRTLTQGARRLNSVIRFLPGSNAVDSLARDDIGRAAPTIREALDQGSIVRLIGHTDDEGDAAVNRRLARDRADAIRVAFEAQGLYGLQVDSAGEMCPIADNAAPSGRQINRRVEIWIQPRAS